MSEYAFFPTLIVRNPAFSYQDYSLKNLEEALQNPYFKKAIKLASVSLYEQLEKKGFLLEHMDTKMRTTLWKYFNRLCFRPTPFGLFAATSVMQWGVAEQAVLTNFKAHTMVDFEFGVQQQLLPLFQHRRFQVNTTIYTAGREFRFLTAWREPNESDRKFFIKSIVKIPILQKIIAFCHSLKTYPSIVSFIGAETGLTVAEAEKLLETLISIQFLVDDHDVNIIGDDYFVSHNDAPDLDTDQAAPCYLNLIGECYSGSLHTRYQRTIKKAVDCLHILLKNAPLDKPMQRFVTAFNRKFEGQRIPLLYALDPETGIGYEGLEAEIEGQDLLDGINWSAKADYNLPVYWSSAHSLLLEKWNTSTLARKTIVLTPGDISAIDDNIQGAPTPQTMSTLFKVVNGQVIVESIGGITGTALIGRFTPFDEKIAGFAKEVADFEAAQNPGVIFAEIAHICESHTANINRRQHIYAYEIPVLTRSVLPESKQFTPSDLYVSIVNDEIILFSESMQKRVIPRLSSAFNFKRNHLSLYRFLCDLQFQGINGNLNLDLKNYFPGMNFYPRVQFGDSILYLATWYLSRIELTDLQSLNPTLPAEVNRIIEKLSLPRWIALTSHDNQLVFDLMSTEQLTVFLTIIKGQKKITIKEHLYEITDTPLVKDEGGKPYAGQFIATLYRRGRTYAATNLARHPPAKSTRRIVPGDGWVYYKVYIHPSRQNEVLLILYKRCIAPLCGQNTVMQWFFIRYTDPEPHLRIRLKVKKDLDATVIASLNHQLKQCLKNGLVADYLIAIYERELERYGHLTMDSFEQIFFKSSELNIRFFKALIKNEVMPPNLLIIFSNVSLIMENFNFFGVQRLSFLTQVTHSLLCEFNDQADLKYALDSKYKQMKSLLTAWENGDLMVKKALLWKHSSDFAQSIRYLAQGTARSKTDQQFKWAADIIHMHLNRFFLSEQRKQELVVYYLLMKHESAKLARTANQAVSIIPA
ncbi:lantibiotic dehydratase [Mucilaginibacter gilvus]|uniref:Lantibiotic dehydratase n=1 Tax=Mucilaginibacter gilvus TaxID=2305909 RepID=A0A444MSR3_9SPHI|nr:lantibiotic dehydratase [Mucilaginibacter gilvus]RWY55656.1 hypothetical protein EPL05_04585 [Mucilaginibacter gilvus]